MQQVSIPTRVEMRDGIGVPVGQALIRYYINVSFLIEIQYLQDFFFKHYYENIGSLKNIFTGQLY